MFCTNCGTAILEEAHFCASCGTRVSASSNGISNGPVTDTEQTSKKLEGLGGWLILVIFGLFLTVLFQAFGAYESIRLFADGTVQFLSNPSSEVYIAGYSALLKFELIYEILLITAAFYLIILFFRKSSKFPRYYLPYLAVIVIVPTLDYLLVASLPISHQEAREAVDQELSKRSGAIGGAVIGALIWGSYIRKSKRVKATFIRE